MPPSRPPAGPGPALPADWQKSLPGPFATVPLELLGVCALMALAGVLTLWPVVTTLPSLFQLLGAGSYSTALGFLGLAIWLVLGFFGLSCLWLAWRLANRDRVARGLSYVLLGGLGAALLFGQGTHTTSLTLTMLASFAALAVLAAVPRVNEFFRAAEPAGGEPSSVVIARTLVMVWAWMAVLVGLFLLPVAQLSGKYAAAGLLLIGLGAGAFVTNRRLGSADVNARLIVSIGAAAYIVMLLIIGSRDAGLLMPLALSAGIVCFLWLPADAKEFFTPTAGPTQTPAAG